MIDFPRFQARGPDSAFEEQVAQALSGLGHDVDHQVRAACFRIDLAVRDPRRPGCYLLGIECDVQCYYRRRSLRDRDRVRQRILENRDWTIHRIWSGDWFRNPSEELRKVDAAIGPYPDSNLADS